MKTEAPKRKKRRWLKIVLIVVAVLIIIRLILPYVLLKYINHTLTTLKEYTGHVEDIDLAIIRGAYQVNGINIMKKDTVTGKPDSIPFFASPNVDLSVEWNALFKGKLVGEIYVRDPVVNFVKGMAKDKEAKRDTSDFRTLIRKMMPLSINHFEVNNGQVRYIDKGSKPAVDIAITNLEIKADNLTNVNDSNKVLPAALAATGSAYDGSLDLKVKFNALEKQPTFDLNASVKGVNMVKLNDFFKAYGKFDVNKGTFGLYTEMAARDGRFNGYVKPIIKDLDVVEFTKEEGNFFQILWESVVGATAEVFQNQKHEQLGTKVPLHGSFNNAQSSIWTAINYVLRNAFVAALRPSVDDSIDLGDAQNAGEEKKTFLQKVFGKKDKTKDDETKKKGDADQKKNK
jgi:hypothetical protein